MWPICDWCGTELERFAKSAGKCPKCGSSEDSRERGNISHVCGLAGYGALGDACPACAARDRKPIQTYRIRGVAECTCGDSDFGHVCPVHTTSPAEAERFRQHENSVHLVPTVEEIQAARKFRASRPNGERISVQLAAYRAEGERQVNEKWRSWGVCEIAIRNKQVSDYMGHWEKRAEAAEAKLKQLYSLEWIESSMKERLTAARAEERKRCAEIARNFMLRLSIAGHDLDMRQPGDCIAVAIEKEDQK